MIRAIIFDCFGVLAEDGWSPFKKQYLANAAKAAEVARAGKAVDSGQESYDHMITQTARISGVSAALVRAAVERRVPNEPLFEYIRKQLAAQYKIGMLSNASYDVTANLFTQKQMEVFDATVLSYEAGLVKPDPKMYWLIAKRLGVPVQDCLLVDDQARHAAGAINAGMQAIEYTSLDSMKHTLAQMGVGTK